MVNGENGRNAGILQGESREAIFYFRPVLPVSSQSFPPIIERS